MADQEGVRDDFAMGVDRHEDATIVSFSGELDVLAAQSMRDTLLEPDLLSASAVHVDLSQATFLDSSAIGILVAGSRRVRQEGGSYSVYCSEGTVRRVLEISGLLEYLNVTAEPPAAL